MNDDEKKDELEDETVENEEGENEESTEEVTDEKPEEAPELPVGVQIVQAALQGNAVGVRDLFKAAMSDRIADVVANRKMEIANSLITPDQPAEEQPKESDNEETETNNPSDNVQGTESE